MRAAAVGSSGRRHPRRAVLAQPPHADAGHLNAMTADMVHEMPTLLTVLVVAIHEEHFFQIITMEGPEH
ncbi:MAG: hypothetical protein EOP37_13425 [Rubrivivax sp.]|nr:MAG: hypothetical protein EOP37_13425 [Rubrivivax sp.]